MKLVILAIALSWIGIVVLLYFMQDRYIYFPTRDIGGHPEAVGLSAEDVWIDTADGETLHGWFVPHPGPLATVLFFHGNAGNITHRLGTLRVLHDIGVAVLIVDYRGYGRSTGKPTEDGTYRDADAAWQYLTTARQLRADQIVIYGRSLGGAVATDLAARRLPRALIVESTFTSIRAMAAAQYPFLPTRWLVRIRYPTIERIGKVESPILIAHSKDDRIIPFAHAEQIRAAAGGARLYELSGDHNEGFSLAGERYYDTLKQFIVSAAP